MSFGLLLTGIIFGGLGTLTFLVFAIISLAGGKRRNSILFSALFLVFFITLLFSISGMVRRAVSTVKEIGHSVKESANEYERTERERREARRKWLRDATPEEFRDSISDDFFESYDSKRNVYCVPLVYPYRLEMKKSYIDNAYLAAVNGPSTDVVLEIRSVTEAAFDENFLLVKRDYASTHEAPPNDLPEVSYLIFDLKKGTATTYYNRERLMTEAAKLGYKGSTELEDVSDLYDNIY